MTAPPELRLQRRRWFVELGYADGNGIGTWEHTKESIEVASQSEARAMEAEWLASGILQTMPWGELRPKYSYGIYRVRSEWVDEDLTAAIRAAWADALREAVDAARQIADHNRDHWREDMGAGADEAADAIETLIPGKEKP